MAIIVSSRQFRCRNARCWLWCWSGLYSNSSFGMQWAHITVCALIIIMFFISLLYEYVWIKTNWRWRYYDNDTRTPSLHYQHNWIRTLFFCFCCRWAYSFLDFCRLQIDWFSSIHVSTTWIFTRFFNTRKALKKKWNRCVTHRVIQ